MPLISDELTGLAGMGEGDFYLDEGDYVWTGELIGVVYLWGFYVREMWGWGWDLEVVKGGSYVVGGSFWVCVRV